jgi:hypothetical protein
VCREALYPSKEATMDALSHAASLQNDHESTSQSFHPIFEREKIDAKTEYGENDHEMKDNFQSSFGKSSIPPPIKLLSRAVSYEPTFIPPYYPPPK